MVKLESSIHYVMRLYRDMQGEGILSVYMSASGLTETVRLWKILERCVCTIMYTRGREMYLVWDMDVSKLSSSTGTCLEEITVDISMGEGWLRW